MTNGKESPPKGNAPQGKTEAQKKKLADALRRNLARRKQGGGKSGHEKQDAGV